MRDVETETLWSHLLGKGMRGELKGVQLEVLPGTTTTWAEWKERHPETTLLGMSRTARRYNEEVWRKPERFVYGVHLGADSPSPAVTIGKLQKESLVQFEAAGKKMLVTYAKHGSRAQAFERILDGKEIQFAVAEGERMKDRATSSTWDVVTGECLKGKLQGKKLTILPGTISYRTAWEQFFPKGEVIE